LVKKDELQTVLNPPQNTSQPSVSKREVSQSKESGKQRFQLTDGIVGLKNNSYYCYMNACL